MSSTQCALPRRSYIPEFVVGVPTITSLGRAARAGAWLVLFGLAYFLAAVLSRGELFQRSRIGLVWVPNAILVAAFVLTGRQTRWRIVAATVVAHILGMALDNPWWRMAWQIPTNLLFAVVTAEALRRFVGFPLRFESRRQVFAYTAVALVMPLFLACIAPAFVLSLVGIETFYPPATAFIRLALANLSPLLLVTPVILLAARLDLRQLKTISRVRSFEIASMAAVLLAVSLAAFATNPELARFPWLLALTIPPLIWAAVRFGPLGASAALFSIAAVAVWGAAHQLGPFVVRPDDDIVLSLQLYLIIICPPVLLLAAAVREREQAEAALGDQRTQLAHVMRAATVGELSSALAHQLRQPLTAILANAQAARLTLLRPPVNYLDVREMLEDVEQQAQHAAGVISRLQHFVRRGPSVLEPLHVDALVRDALALGKSVIDLAGVTVESSVAGDLPRIRGDAIQLLQVMLNLILNACEAMSVAAAERRLVVQVVHGDPAHVEILIVDSGIGLPKGHAERAFEPFFTTKHDGLGLGLSAARSIIVSHGGRLWAENNARGGATFHLVLPAESGNVGARC